MPITKEEIDQIATKTAEKVMDRKRRLEEQQELRDIFISSVAGEGAIPLYGRETRREICRGCRIDPSKPLEAGNVMATTSDAIGMLSTDEVRKWCSEIIEVSDGRCERVRTIRRAAKECKVKYPGDTEAFMRCYAPAFAQITHSSSPATEVTVACPLCEKVIEIGEYDSVTRTDALKKHLEEEHS